MFGVATKKDRKFYNAQQEQEEGECIFLEGPTSCKIRRRLIIDTFRLLGPFHSDSFLPQIRLPPVEQIS